MSLIANMMLRETLPFPREHINQYFDQITKNIYQSYISYVKQNKQIECHLQYYFREWGEKKTLGVIEHNKAMALAFSHEFIDCYRDVSGISIQELVKKKPKKYLCIDYLHLTNVSHFNGGAK